MAEFYLVRHGQASFGAKNYDNLSQLGHQQARWLGDYFNARGVEFSQIYRGDMQRHAQTAEGIVLGLENKPNTIVHTGFNEFDFQKVGKGYLSAFPEKALPENPKPADFYRLLKLAMYAWSQDELDKTHLQESWLEFQARVRQALSEVCAQNIKQPILIVSSGGAIAMLMSLVLGIDAKQVIELNMQIRNTSISHFYFNKDTIRLASFNNIPHLDHPDRLDAITFS